MSRRMAGRADTLVSDNDGDDDELYCTVRTAEGTRKAAGGSERLSLCSRSGLRGRLDELERTAGLLTPHEWLICRGGAARRQSQTKLCQSSMNRRKRGVEAVRTEVTRPAVNLAGVWGDGGSKDGRSSFTQIDRQGRGSGAGPRRMAS